MNGIDDRKLTQVGSRKETSLCSRIVGRMKRQVDFIILGNKLDNSITELSNFEQLSSALYFLVEVVHNDSRC